MKVPGVLLSLALLTISLSNVHLDMQLEDYHPNETYKCLKQQNIIIPTLRLYNANGTVNVDAVDNIISARQGGYVYIDGLMSPCRGKNGTDQMKTLYNTVYAKTFATLWITVLSDMNTSSFCSWGSFPTWSNCNYLRELTDWAARWGTQTGVYTTKQDWEIIMGTNCTRDVLLNYISNDNVTSFADFVPFGGWNIPT